MAKTTADFMLERLTEWGVRNIYGYPGDGINSTLKAMGKAIDRFTFVQSRHEEESAFMACAHAKWTGEPGVCLATSGPGAIHLLNGLYDAKLDHQPVVAIIGQQDRAALGGSYQQEVDLLTLFKDVAHNYVHYCQSPTQMRHLIDRAFRIAKAKRCVTAIILPDDVGEEPAVEQAPHEHGTIHSGIGYAKMPRMIPEEADLREAAAILNQAERPAIVIGAGALGAGDEVRAVAERLSAGVCKALLGKAALPDDLPYVTGQMGLLGTSPSYDLMMECDAFLMVGSGFPYSEFLPEEGAARGVQIDIDPGMLSIRCPSCYRCWKRRIAATGAKRSKRTSATGGKVSRSARISRPSRSIRSFCSGNAPQGCPTGRSSPPTAARPRTGMPAPYASARA